MFKQKSFGQLVVIAGLIEIAGSVISYSFDLMTKLNFRIWIIAGILIEAFVLMVILKRKEI